MLRSVLIAGALLCANAFAQEVDRCAPCGSEPRWAGVYDMASGTFIPASQLGGGVDVNNQDIYDNTCSSGFFSSTLNGSTIIDDGRVPAPNTPVPNQGSRASYRVNSFEVGYCTRELDPSAGGPGASVRVRIWEDYDDCQTLALAGAPTADFTINGLPASATAGTLACWLVTINLAGGNEFCMKAEANGTFDNTDTLDGFGYGLTMLNQTGTTNSTVGGFIIAGKPTGLPSCPVGSSTYYHSPGAAQGTGLGDNDLFRRDGLGGQTSGCLFFGGNPFAGFHLRLIADLDDCSVCTPNDFDGDGVVDCLDGCPGDALKTSPGICGCGVADVDSDGDGTPDCIDGCPSDPNKTGPGQCGCGFPDTDSDGDGVADCVDGCPSDPNKSNPGQCGCGNPDTDSDGDGVADCVDGCPSDPNKTSPGQCGCGVSDVDFDGDGVADCNDGCPFDFFKTAPGQCGCGNPDTDTDGDGVADCIDGCPNDPAKIAPGQCGCGFPDTDSDGDGFADCVDGCPSDPLKQAPGACGCGTPDTDTDGDGVADCIDNCPSLSNPGQEDCNGNTIGDVCDIASAFSIDANGDNIPDECQQGAGTPFCFGDGSGTPCPCANNDGAGAGCANSTGNGSLLYNVGGASVGADDTMLYANRMAANKFGLVYMGTQNVSGLTFGDGLRCVKGFTKRFPIQNSGATGSYSLIGAAGQSSGLITAGTTWYFQSWYRDNTHGSCTSQFNLSNGLEVNFVP
jgi:hypothetical protein